MNHPAWCNPLHCSAGVASDPNCTDGSDAYTEAAAICRRNTAMDQSARAVSALHPSNGQSPQQQAFGTTLD